MSTQPNTIAISGGLDPIHCGHIRMIQDAHNYGRVYVILNSDEWLMRKKGYVFMPWAQRAEMLRAIKWVYDVLPVDDSDGTVCQVLKDMVIPYEGRNYHFTWFGNGGDRKGDNTPEVKLCNELGIKLAWGVGGSDKVSSSSELVNKAASAEQQLAKEYKHYLETALSYMRKSDSLSPEQTNFMMKTIAHFGMKWDELQRKII